MAIICTDEALGSGMSLSDIETYMKATYKHKMDAQSAMSRLNRQWLYDRFLWWTRDRKTVMESDVLPYEFTRHLERECGKVTLGGVTL